MHYLSVNTASHSRNSSQSDKKEEEQRRRYIAVSRGGGYIKRGEYSATKMAITLTCWDGKFNLRIQS